LRFFTPVNFKQMLTVEKIKIQARVSESKQLCFYHNAGLTEAENKTATKLIMESLTSSTD